MTATAALSPRLQGLPGTGAWQVDPNHSSVGFRLIHHGVSTFRCGFKDFEARFDAEADVITGTVKVESVQAFPMLRDRLFETDFFDLANHPEMRFASTDIVRSANQVAVEGELTIKWVTRPVRAEGIVLGTTPVFHYPTKTTHEHFGLDAQLTIDRREFNLSFNSELPGGLLNLGSHVTIELALEFVRTEPIS
ncbi:MAG TPA: YceI family protein [Solirubrobacteraceae bacterium]